MRLAASTHTFGSAIAASWIYAGCVALAVGSFLSWAHADDLVADGMDGDGWITVELAVVIAVVVAPMLRSALGEFRSAVLILAALAAAYVCLDSAAHAETLVDAPRGADVDLGIGMYITVAGAIAILVGIVLALRRHALFDHEL